MFAFRKMLLFALFTTPLWAAPATRIVSPVKYRTIGVGDSILLRGEVTGTTREGTWQIQKLGAESAPVTLQGNQPERYRFQEQGLYQLTFSVSANGETAPRTIENSRLIAVTVNDINFEPYLDYEGDTRFVVANGTTLDFEVQADDFENSFPEDYPGNFVTVFWLVNGTLAGTGENFSLPLNIDADAFSRGSVPVTLEIFAADSENKASEDRYRIDIYVYNDERPPEPGFNGTKANQTLFLAQGTRYDIQPSLGFAGNTTWLRRWRAVHLQSGRVLLDSDATQPPPIDLDEPGVVSLEFDVVSSDGTRAAAAPHRVWLYTYDPNADITVKITEPSTDALRFEAGGAINITDETGIRMKAFIYDPNLFQPTDPSQTFRQIGIATRWSFLRPDGGTLLLDGVENNATWIFEIIGTWHLTMSAYNSLGITSSQPDQMSIEVAEAGSLNDAEPNNSREQATATQFGSFAGLSLSDSDPVDWFAFDLDQAGENLLINLDLRRAQGDVEVAVYQGERQVHRERLPGGKFHPFSFVSADPGRYFLEAVLVDPAKHKAGLEFGLAVSASIPRLSFPKVREDDATTTDISLVNPTNGEARVSLEARNPNGEILQVIALDLPAKGRLRRGVTDLFPAADKLDIEWVRVLSDRAITGSFTLRGRDGQSESAEPAQSGLLHELVMPHVARDTSVWYTEVGLVNNSAEQISPSLNTPASAFDLDVDRPYRGETVNFNTLFNNRIPAGNEWGMFREENNLPALAGVELFGFQDATQTAALNLASPRAKNPNFVYTRNDIVFPHVAADTAQFWTGLAYVNTGTTTATLNLKAYHADGRLLGQQSATAAPGDKVVALAHELFDSLDAGAQIGWIKLETTGSIQGYELFGSNRADRRRLAGLAAVAGGAKKVHFPDVLSNAERWTGLAVVNLAESNSAGLTYAAYDDSGALVAEVTQTLAPLAKQVTLVSALFGSERAQRIAWIQLDADQPLASFQLSGDFAGHNMSGMTAQ